MAAKEAPATGAAKSAAATEPKLTETLSQFVARVLNQLSLSAWLPSAALVLAMDFIVQFDTQLDVKSQGVDTTLANTFARMSGIGFGGVVLLVVAVVVLTMLTQAFSFEAIQVLEGYWGISPLAEWFADRRCDKYRRTRTRLVERRKEFTRTAWNGAVVRLTEREAERHCRGWQAQVTLNMLLILGPQVLGSGELIRLTRSLVHLTQEEEKRIKFLRANWESYAPADSLHRSANMDKRLADYPAAERMLPTRLGNILRAHEDKIRRVQVRSFVQEVYDVLPPGLQVGHDAQRTRLDLYCSMVFVLAAAWKSPSCGSR